MNMKMNLNTLINKIFFLTIIFTVLFGSSAFSQQNLISWEVADPSLNRKFIEMYLNKLIENDKFDQNSIQASDVIMVQMQQEDGKLTLKRLRAKNYDSIENLEKNSLDFYASVKSLYLQDRQQKILNSKKIINTQDDSDWEEITQ